MIPGLDWLRRAPALPILVLMSLLGLLALDLGRRRAEIDELSAVRKLGQIEADAAVAHLWVEEWLSGDDIDVPVLEGRLQRLEEVSAALVAGPWAEAEPITRADLANLAKDIEQFQQITRDRIDGRQRGLDVGIGSQFDIEYDRVFNRALDRVSRLEQIFEEVHSSTQRQYSVYFRSLLAVCALAALLASWLYLRRERDRLRVEKELAQQEESLLRLQKIETLGRLASGLMHDINNYLAAIRSQCELLGMELEEGGEARHAGRRLRTVLGTAARASALIDRLLAFGTGRPAVAEAVDLGTLLAAMRPMIDSAAPDGVRIEVDLPADLWPLAAESNHLEQAMLNLMLNGIDALEGSGSLRIAAGNRESALGSDQPRDAVEIVVSDDGRGIAALDIPRVFDPFWSTKTQHGHGSGHAGLGLAVVQSFISRAKGQISVESVRAGEGSHAPPGTTFTLLLPRAQGLPAAALLAGRTADGTLPLDELRGDECLLLVDDHEELREATAMMLETLGYEVRTAIGAKEASAMGAVAMPDAIIVDIRLPDGDGLDLVSELRQRHGALPAVAYTGQSAFALGSWAERCEELQIPMVIKNAPTRDLLVALRQVLG